MTIINKGFKPKHGKNLDRLPPGQYETIDFPVLSLGPTPFISKDEWTLEISGLAKAIIFNFEELKKLPQIAWEKDIHCVTKWSKFDTKWQGVFIDEIIKITKVDPKATHIIAYSYDGYSTNLPLNEIINGQAMVAISYEGMDIPPEHGGPVRMVIPHLYFWKSAKWLNKIEFTNHDQPGFWETRGYNNHGDPWKEERYSEF